MSSNTFQYTGRENDGNGLYYYRARYYSPVLNRFISQDPIWFRGGINSYTYVLDSPPNFTDPLGLDKHKKGVFSCASENAARVSLAGIAQSFGAPKDGVRGFIVNALGGNAFSGATDLFQSFANGEAGGHNVFYNIGQGVAAGPSLGFSATARLFGQSLEGTPWASGPVDAVTNGIVNQLGSLVTDSGDTIQTLNDATELGTVLSETGEVAEFATGFGEIKLGYDASTYFGGLIGCATGILH